MFREVKKEDVQPGPRWGRRVAELNRFIESGIPVAEVITDEENPLEKLYAAFFTANKRMGNPITVTRRGGRLFFIKKEGNDAE